MLVFLYNPKIFDTLLCNCALSLFINCLVLCKITTLANALVSTILILTGTDPSTPSENDFDYFAFCTVPLKRRMLLNWWPAQDQYGSLLNSKPWARFKLLSIFVTV